MTTLEIHTSDRGTFKRCRRKFGWGSTLRRNLVVFGPDQKAFFLGSGFHFAMEDYWSYRRFEHPSLAFAAYVDAQKPSDLPDDLDGILDLATGMIEYYVEEWLVEHPEPFETLWIDGKPQVEVEIAIRLNELLFEELDRRAVASGNPAAFRAVYARLYEIIEKDDIEYVCTFDRVVIDKHERIFGLDYKTAAQFDELNLQTNPQSGSYNWGMDLFYVPHGYKPEGIVWQQHKKLVPHPPEKLKKGGLSLDIRQSTTYRLYKRAVIEEYGTIPAKYLDILATLANQQDYDGDRFVRRDVLRLNEKQREAEQQKIIDEVLEMLDPNLILYPNPTKDCSWDCPFKAPCLALDDGSDAELLLGLGYTQWSGYKDDWRARIKYPAAIES